MEERVSGVKDKVEEMDITGKENVRPTNNQGTKYLGNLEYNKNNPWKMGIEKGEEVQVEGTKVFLTKS